MDELLLLLQMVNPNLRAWASQDPWLVELPAQECPAQPEGSDGTLGLGWWQHSSTVLLLSPGWSCHFRHCTNPTEALLAWGARALLCRTLGNVEGLPGVKLPGEDKDHQVPTQQIREGILANHWTHLKFSLWESLWDFSAACPRRVFLVSN